MHAGMTIFQLLNILFQKQKINIEKHHFIMLHYMIKLMLSITWFPREQNDKNNDEIRNILKKKKKLV